MAQECQACGQRGSENSSCLQEVAGAGTQQRRARGQEADGTGKGDFSLKRTRILCLIM